jgi:hypothetical protein
MAAHYDVQLKMSFHVKSLICIDHRLSKKCRKELWNQNMKKIYRDHFIRGLMKTLYEVLWKQLVLLCAYVHILLSWAPNPSRLSNWFGKEVRMSLIRRCCLYTTQFSGFWIHRTNITSTRKCWQQILLQLEDNESRKLFCILKQQYSSAT